MFELQPIKSEIIIDGFNSVYYFEFGKNFTHIPEKHNFWEMVYVDCGSIVAIQNNRSIPLSQGQVIFHAPNEVHAHISNKNDSNNMLVISFTASSPVLEHLKEQFFTLDKTEKTLIKLFTDEYKSSFSSLPNLFEDKNSLDFSNAPLGSTQLLSCYVTELLFHLIRKINFVNAKENQTTHSTNNCSISESIAEYLGNNIYNDITLNELCKHFLMSKSKLSELFTSDYHISPMQYYAQLKFINAKILLRENNYSVSAISDMLGYSSIHAFTRAFKNETGFTPSEYKKGIIS